MRHLSLALLTVLAAFSASAQTNPMNKPGLYEMTFTKQTMNGQDMLAQMKAMQAQMAKLPPEQRKAIEQQTGGMFGSTMRMCMSEQMIKKNGDAVSASTQRRPGDECDTPKTSTTGKVSTMSMTCKGKQGTSVINSKATALSDTAMRVESNVVTTTASGKTTFETDMQMKYLGTDCGNVKPIDEIAKQYQQPPAKK